MNNYDKAAKSAKAYREALEGINVKENEKIVLECKNIWSYDFARDISGADIKAHEQVILEFKEPQLSFLFAKDIPGANIEEFFKIILNSGDKLWLYEFIKHVNYKETKVEEWLLYI